MNRTGGRGLQSMHPMPRGAPLSRARTPGLRPAARRLPGVLLLLLLLLLGQAACCARLPAPIELQSDDWGTYRVQAPAGSVSRLAFVFGAAADATLDATVQALAQHGALAPARGADFEVSICGWLGRGNAGAAPTLPELQRIPPAKVLCVYGAKEKTESLCTAPGAGAVTRLERPGDHHFDRRYDLIANAIRAHLAAGKP